MEERKLGADECYCSSCGSVIKKRAVLCPQCGVAVCGNSPNKWVAVLLAFFLGSLGIQWFYLGNITMGILSLIFCWTCIPAIISFFHFIILLCSSQESISRKYCR